MAAAVRRRRSDLSERAARAAEDEPRAPRVNWAFLAWLGGRVAALLTVFAASYVLYDCASSDRFQVRQVRVSGNVLLSESDVHTAASVIGANIFWVDRRVVEARLRHLPAVQRVEVTPLLPDSVEIHVIERRPAAVWRVGDAAYLVDREGVVIKAADPADPASCPPAACAMGLAAVSQVDGPPVAPGGRVDASALAASARLAALLPSAGVEPTAFEWSRDQGLEVTTRQGVRVRFDGRGDLDWQIASLAAIRQRLAETRQPAQVIDVRFGDRPYVR